MKLNIIRTGPLGYKYPGIEDVVKAIFPDHSISPDDWSPVVDGIDFEWVRGPGYRANPTALRLSFQSAADYRLQWRSVSIKDGAIDDDAVRSKHAELVTLKAEHDARGAELRAKRVEADEQLRELRAKVEGSDCLLLPCGDGYGTCRYELRFPPLTEAQVIRIAEAVKEILAERIDSPAND